MQNNNLKINKKFISSKLTYGLFFTSLCFYLASLIGCYDSIKICSSYKKYKIYFLLGICLVISSLFFGILVFIKLLERSRYLDNVIFFLIYTIIFLLSNGTDFANHGTYNSIIFLILFPIFTFIIFILYLFIYYCLNCQLKKLLFLFLIFIYPILLFLSKTKCYKFFNGIGGINLKNDPKSDKCFIEKPSICGLTLLSGLFDVNYFTINNCIDKRNQKEIFLKYLDETFINFNNFSFPRTEYWNQSISFQNLAELVEKEIKPVNNTNSKDNEIFVSFKEGKGEIEMYLKRNDSLINYKRKLAYKYPVKFNNVYIIYFDSLSRNNFIRKLKNSTKLIEKILYTNNKKDKFYKQFNAFQFFKYYTFNGNTEGNIFPIFYGNKRNSDTGYSILKFFNDKGYITASTHNSCNKEIFDWESKRYNITFDNYDHENVAMFCDTNFEDKHKKWSIIKGKSSILRKCLYGKDSFEYNFNYISQFLEIYKNERKYFRISISDGHEGTAEVIKYVDNYLSSFISNILSNYFDEKSVFIILSDHGAHLPGPYDILLYNERIIEKYLGLLLFILPNKKKFNYSNILYNQQKFLTTYDIHDSILDFINVNKYNFPRMRQNIGQSLFLKINGNNRSCENYYDEITKDFCFCKNYL